MFSFSKNFNFKQKLIETSNKANSEIETILGLLISFGKNSNLNGFWLWKK